MCWLIDEDSLRSIQHLWFCLLPFFFIFFYVVSYFLAFFHIISHFISFGRFISFLFWLNLFTILFGLNTKRKSRCLSFSFIHSCSFFAFTEHGTAFFKTSWIDRDVIVTFSYQFSSYLFEISCTFDESGLIQGWTISTSTVFMFVFLYKISIQFSQVSHQHFPFAVAKL